MQRNDIFVLSKCKLHKVFDIAGIQITSIYPALALYLEGMCFGTLDDLAGELDIRLSSADDSAVLILIIVLFFAQNVNGTDDIPVAVIGIEKLRTSYLPS